MKTAFKLLIILPLAGLGLLAQETPPPFTPKKDTAPDSVLFPDIQREARRLNDAILAARIKLADTVVPTAESVAADFPLTDLGSFGRLVQIQAGNRLAAHGFEKLDTQLAYFARALSTPEEARADMPEFQLIFDSQETLFYLFTGDQAENTAVLMRQKDPDIEVTTATGRVKTTKEEALGELRDAINPYKLNDAAYDAFKTRGQLMEMAKEWDAFFDEGRPQTFWDIGLTTLMEYKHIRRDRLVGPPPRQWFLLHPNVVIENIDSAPDGDQLGGAVVIEWIGVNWWNLKIPFGLSVSSLYSDRPGVKDVGHGVTLYFDNKYCLGWASHGGDNGFYLSLDALKLIDDKKSKVEEFRSKLKEKMSQAGLN